MRLRPMNAPRGRSGGAYLSREPRIAVIASPLGQGREAGAAGTDGKRSGVTLASQITAATGRVSLLLREAQTQAGCAFAADPLNRTGRVSLLPALMSHFSFLLRLSRRFSND